MARLTPLEQCLKTRRGVVFDTSVLITLFAYERSNGRPFPLLLRVPPTRRYTSTVARGEFICNIAFVAAAQRVQWLQEKQIRVLPLTAAVSTSFTNLTPPGVPCAFLGDFLIAATAMAGDFALAAEDHDFDRLGALTTVAEFARR